ncbi:HAUS augmin-like complex subunit 3 [Carettochelys insculpta]|uniref:HAUS augmin-like complex subunit 3 n=1 Tax=Carettochelys insculpta TaxID=44489 RepID=UPI003EBEAC33
MFTRRRSRGFLLDTVRGAEFLETLKTISCPKADALDGKDFDWLFDCSETVQFLEWFCNTVGEENALSPGEVEAYRALLDSGKPILEGEALEQVLQTCHPCPQLKSAMSEEEAPRLEVLEEEARALQSHRDRQLQRLNKLQSRSASLKQDLYHLSDKEEKVLQELRRAQLDVDRENSQTNCVLSQACKTANKLVEWHREAGSGRPPVLMSEVDLGHYTELEELTTGVLAAFIQKALPGVEGTGFQRVKRQESPQANPEAQARAELAQTVMPENTGSLQKHVVDPKVGVETQEELVRATVAGLPQKAYSKGDDGAKAEDVQNLVGWEGCWDVGMGLAEAAHGLLGSMGTPEAELFCSRGRVQEELERMQLAYVCCQKERIATSAEVEGISAGLQWAERTLKSIKVNKMTEEESGCHIATSQKQLCALQSEREQIQTQRLMPLLQAAARLLRLPVLHATLEEEALNLGQLTLKQEEVAGQLMAQHSRLELLRLQLEREKKEQQQVGTWLEEMAAALQEASAELRERLACLEDSSLYVKDSPRIVMQSTDLAALRLWEILKKQGQEKQLFRTYETLASRGSRLCQDKRMLEVQLAGSPLQLPALESDSELLYGMIYGDSNQVLLNAQELTEPMEQLYATQAKLYQMVMDLLSNLRAKRKSLQGKHQQTERSLYVHFFCDAHRLREVVQQLEKEALPFS